MSSISLSQYLSFDSAEWVCAVVKNTSAGQLFCCFFFQKESRKLPNDFISEKSFVLDILFYYLYYYYFFI